MANGRSKADDHDQAPNSQGERLPEKGQGAAHHDQADDAAGQMRLAGALGAHHVRRQNLEGCARQNQQKHEQHGWLKSLRERANDDEHTGKPARCQPPTQWRHMLAEQARGGEGDDQRREHHNRREIRHGHVAQAGKTEHGGYHHHQTARDVQRRLGDAQTFEFTGLGEQGCSGKRLNQISQPLHHHNRRGHANQLACGVEYGEEKSGGDGAGDAPEGL